MPQPLKHYGSVVLEPYDALQREPTLAAHIGTIAAMWTAVEMDLGKILVFLLNAEAAAAAEVYSTLVNIDPRLKVLKLLAKARLPPTLFAKLETLLDKTRRRVRERNTVVHGLWCYSEGHPGALILHHPAERIASLGRHLTTVFAPSIQFPYEAPKFMEYREKDFLAIQNKIRSLDAELLNLLGDVMELPQRAR
jgi:hypothetical protein